MDWKAAVQPYINSNTINRLPVTINIIMVIAIIYTVAQLTWMLLPVSEFNETIPVTKNPAANPKNGQIKRTTLSQLHLFGEVKVLKQQQARSQVIKAPVTRLNLTLKGVIASGRSDIAKAIIADSSKNENFYSIGSKIPGGAILEEIHVNHVILKRNNRLETLQLPKDVPRGASFRGARNSTAATPRRTSNSSRNKDTGTLLREYKQTLKTDPQKLMDLVRTQPYREKGKLVGYRIRPGKDRTLLRKFGLRSGDVVTAVNGVSLDNPINGLEILKKLTTASQVSVDIKRNGIKKSLSFQVD